MGVSLGSLAVGAAADVAGWQADNTTEMIETIPKSNVTFFILLIMLVFKILVNIEL